MKRPNGRGSGSDKKRPQTIDGETGTADPTPPEKRRIDLSSLRDVRLELAAVYRKMDAGEIESQDGTRRAYVLTAVGKVIEAEIQAELMERVTALEERLGGNARLPAPSYPAATQ